jgi:hypothetical protein
MPSMRGFIVRTGEFSFTYGIAGYIAVEMMNTCWYSMQEAITPTGLPALGYTTVATQAKNFMFGNIARIIRGSHGLVVLHNMLSLVCDGREDEAIELQSRSRNNATKSMFRAIKWALALNAVYPRLGRTRSPAEDMVIAIHLNRLFTNGYVDTTIDGDEVKIPGGVRAADRYRLQAKVAEVYWQLDTDPSADELRLGQVSFDLVGEPVSGASNALWDYFTRKRASRTAT